MNATQIYLEKRRKVIVSSRGKNEEKALVVTISKNLENLGYILSRKLFNRLTTCGRDALESFYKNIVPALKKMRGAHRQFSPMYPNFPQQVMEASYLELYFNAILHYWSYGELSPNYIKKERLPLDEKGNLEVIDLGTEDDFRGIFTAILASNSSISQSDKDIVEWFVKEYSDKVINFLPESIPQKENLGLIAGLLLKYTKSANELSKIVKTATDVLRIAVSFSGGDVSLAENTKFVKMSRPTRKFLLNLLEKCGNLKEDMVRFEGNWIRLGEKLHPGEYSNRFPIAFAAFQALRNSESIETFNSKVERCILKHRFQDVSEVLKERPGEFARRLDHLVRSSSKPINIVERFAEIAHNVSVPVLLQVYSHFRGRTNQTDRAVFPKGSVAKVQVLPGNKPLPSSLCSAITSTTYTTLVSKFKSLPKLDNVYIDDELKNYLVPFSQRSAAKTLKTIVRGSHLPLGDFDTIRFFIWWKNGVERVDIDLTAALLKPDWTLLDFVSYWNLKNFGGHHSGDIVSAPQGASEFIDISTSKVLQMGGRYIAMSVNSFTSQPYCDLPECFAGWMGRQSPKSGEIFEPKTVHNKIDLTSNTRMCIPMVIDCLEKKVIWCDLAVKNQPNWANNVLNNQNTTSLVCKALSELKTKKASLYDLFEMHGKARGRIVKDKSKADIVFGTDKAFAIDEVLSNYMG